uniref:hypothetical protein n=1 Tax=Shewanella sp. TaxID=50422 RepID=UPI004047BC4E
MTPYSEYDHNLYNYFLDKVRIAVFDIRTKEYSWKNFAEVDEEHQRVFAVDIDSEIADADYIDISEDILDMVFDSYMDAYNKSHAVIENYENLFSLMQEAIIAHQIRQDTNEHNDNK